jgi:methylated-DNA-[protein]-cysteine S-methyltransferase
LIFVSICFISSNRYVIGAVGWNLICIIIPCHRVVGTSSLTGYGGGIKNKVELLKLEGIDMNKYFILKIGTAL